MRIISPPPARVSGPTASSSSMSARSSARTWSGPAARVPALEASGAVWLEEPFAGSAYEAYGDLSRRLKGQGLKVAGGRPPTTPTWPAT
jgi:hypothetical protein